MANIGAIRRALVARIEPVPDTTAYAFVTDSVNVPCYFVGPDRPFIDYTQVFQMGRTELHFVLTYLTNRIDEESAQDQIDEFLDPAGQVISNLLNTTVDDTLSQLTSYVELSTVTAARYGSQRVGGTSYFGVQVQFTVMV